MHFSIIFVISFFPKSIDEKDRQIDGLSADV